MRTVTRHCDHCKKEIPKQEWGQIYLVEFSLQNEEMKNRYRSISATRHAQEWCRPCVDEFNMFDFVQPPRKEGDTSPPPPTFEDALREIIRTEIEAATGGRA